MPDVGEIRKNHIWHACEGCGKKRWVQFVKGSPTHKLCLSCCRKGNKNGRWNNGKSQRKKDGYIIIILKSGDFFYSMANLQGHVLEHRLVIAKNLGRCLMPWEVVHHRNGIANDNRIENLRLSTFSDHKREHDRLRHAVKLGKVVRAGLHIIPGVRIFNQPSMVVQR